MPRAATTKRLPGAFRMMKAMQAQGIEWGEDCRRRRPGLEGCPGGADGGGGGASSGGDGTAGRGRPGAVKAGLLAAMNAQRGVKARSAARRFREVRRRSRPMGVFQDRTSMDRILFAVLTHENSNQGVPALFSLTQTF